MLPSLYKLILITTINLIVCSPTYAAAIEQKGMDFQINTNDLMKGNTHYRIETLGPREFATKYPLIFELDSLSLASEADVKIVVEKSVSIVDKPVGFFEEQQMTDEKYLSHVLGDQKVKKISPDTFSIKDHDVQYKMRIFFDADDVSTLPNSKVIRAVTAAKKLDVIAQSASTIMFTEKTNFSKRIEGEIAVSSFIAMKENKTLVITYKLIGLGKEVDGKRLRQDFLKETEAIKNFKSQKE